MNAWMKICSTTLCLLLSVFLLSGCSNNDRPANKQVLTETKPLEANSFRRYCYRNEYPFADQPESKDVLSLTIDINDDRVTGDYNWLPAFKDKRMGRFAGSIEGQLITATYTFTQEGHMDQAAIMIRLDPEQAVVSGGGTELGLRAIIARVTC